MLDYYTTSNIYIHNIKEHLLEYSTTKKSIQCFIINYFVLTPPDLVRSCAL